MWYTRSDEYVFNLDSVRVPAKYPGKRHFKGPKVGQFSGNPLGKNPEDLWDIPNVKNNHIEKTDHPCQFPVGLIERLVLALTNKNGLVFDPFSGVGSAGVAAILHGRRFWGAEIDEAYVQIAKIRIESVGRGEKNYRPHDKPLYDHTRCNLSKRPAEWGNGDVT
jgi:adenine-specific DNA-methyltransferase